MSTAWQSVLQQALALPPNERAQVVVALEQSIGHDDWPPHAVAENSEEAIRGSELLDELRRRSKAIRAGTAKTFSAADVIAELVQRQEAEDDR